MGGNQPLVGSVNTYLTSLDRAIFRWAVVADLLAKSPAASLRKIGFRQMPDIDEPPAVLSVTQCEGRLAWDKFE